MYRWSLAFLLVLGAAFPSGAMPIPFGADTFEGPPRDASLDELIRYIGKHRSLTLERSIRPFSESLGFVEPDMVLGRLANSGATFADVAEAFLEEYELPEQAATALARAHVLSRAHGRGGFDRIVLESLTEDLAIAIRASKGALVAVTSAMRLSIHHRSASDEAQMVRMLEPLAAEFPEVSKSIARAAPVTGPEELWLLALEHDPSLLKSFVLAHPGQGNPALFPAYDKALKTLNLSPKERAAVVRASLDVLLSKRLVVEAVTYFKALPRPEREALLDLPRRQCDGGGRGWLEAREPMLGLSLAASFFLTGDRKNAESIFRQLDASHGETWYALLEAALNRQQDPFELLTRSRDTSGPWGLVTLWLSSTYPAFQADLLREMIRTSYLRNPEDAAHRRRRVTEAMAPLAPRESELQVRWQRQYDALFPRPADPQRSDHVSEGIARLLSSPMLEPCAMRTKTSGPTWKVIDARVPKGFSLVRAAALENQAVALVSEYMGGGYWVMRSRNGGKTWSRPAYLGLRDGAPFSFSQRGTLRLVGGAVIIDAEIPSRRRASPSRYVRSTEIVRLTCDLSVIDRDSDGDGLSDVEEQWLLTDPFHADTDLDGLTDEVDPIPHVPFEGETSMEGLAMLEALSPSTFTPGSVVPRVGPPQGPAKLTGWPATDFVEGSRASLHGLSPSSRLIVLSPKEVRLTTAREGDHHAFQSDFVAVNHSGTQVLIDRRHGYGRHVYLLKKRPDGWHYTQLARSAI